MDFGDIGSLFGDVTGGDILGALTTGAQIYGAFDKNRQAKEGDATALDFKERELAEGTRRWNLEFERKNAAGSGGGGGGGNGAAIAAQREIQKSNLIAQAHSNAAKLALEGRTGEANQLNNILSAMQNVLLSRPQGAMVR